MMRNTLKALCPPVVWGGISMAKRYIAQKGVSRSGESSVKQGESALQSLDIYWDPQMAALLETWGEGNAWHELAFLMACSRGRVLDIACGTGKNIADLSCLANIEFYGCDISDFLIRKAIERGISPERLCVCDATQMEYADNFFDHSYSVGSLEHFTEEGVGKFITETYRITAKSSYHMIPVSKSDNNEGWIQLAQSFFNNSVNWWMTKFRVSYTHVVVIPSLWEDSRSYGKWFICEK
jgi:SAM-dependent methyltransferase